VACGVGSVAGAWAGWKTGDPRGVALRARSAARRRGGVALGPGLGAVLLWTALAAAQGLAPTIVAEGVPPIPAGLDAALDSYRFSQVAALEGWFAGARAIVYRSEAGGTQQVFLLGDSQSFPLQLSSGDRPIAWVCPHPKRERMVLVQDTDGNERYQFLLADLITGQIKAITNARWHNHTPLWSHSGRWLAFSSDARNGRDRDLYVVSPERLSSGRLLAHVAGSCYPEDWSPDDQRLAAVEWDRGARRARVHLIAFSSGQDQIIEPPPGRDVAIQNVRWSRDGRALYWCWDHDSDFRRLARHDLATGQTTCLTPDVAWDVEEFAVSGDGRKIVLSVNEAGYSRLCLLDTATDQLVPAPPGDPGQIANLMFRPGSQEFAFEWTCTQLCRSIFTFDLASRSGAAWVVPPRRGPKAGQGVEAVLCHYPTFDGRLIPVFVRRPRAERGFRRPRPVLIVFHGGPAGQHRPAFSSFDDFLLDQLGLVLVYPNLRGSTGYGRTFAALDDGPRRVDALKDIGALLDWIDAQPELDASRVAVSGASYGGFLALAALTFYGPRLRAGIAAAAPASLETLMQGGGASVLDSWRAEYGDERDPEIRDFFRKISPLAHAANIQKPLLVCHGQNDTRVPAIESDRIAAAVRANGTPVWSIRFQNEGHSFEHRENILYYYHARILFLSRYLLGE
jgi:dipeptidyl aminopeptidase/acylaminoacyl peptidase